MLYRKEIGGFSVRTVTSVYAVRTIFSRFTRFAFFAGIALCTRLTLFSSFSHFTGNALLSRFTFFALFAFFTTSRQTAVYICSAIGIIQPPCAVADLRQLYRNCSGFRLVLYNKSRQGKRKVV